MPKQQTNNTQNTGNINQNQVSGQGQTRQNNTPASILAQAPSPQVTVQNQPQAPVQNQQQASVPYQTPPVQTPMQKQQPVQNPYGKPSNSQQTQATSQSKPGMTPVPHIPIGAQVKKPQNTVIANAPFGQGISPTNLVEDYKPQPVRTNPANISNQNAAAGNGPKILKPGGIVQNLPMSSNQSTQGQINFGQSQSGNQNSASSTNNPQTN